MMEPPKRQKGGRDGRGKGGTAGRRRRQFAVKRGERRQRGSAPHHRTKLLFYVKLVQQQPLMALKCFLAHGGGMSASAVQRVKPRCRLYAQKKKKNIVRSGQLASIEEQPFPRKTKAGRRSLVAARLRSLQPDKENKKKRA